MIEENKITEVKSSTGSFSKLDRKFDNGVFTRAKLNMSTMGTSPLDVTIEILTFEQAKELCGQLETLCCTFEAKESISKEDK